MMYQERYTFWLGADAERIMEAYLIEQAAREAEAMRHLAEQIEE